MNSREMERYCAPLMEVLWESAKCEEAFKSAAAAVAMASSEKFDSDILRTQPFTEKLKAYCIRQRPSPTPVKKGKTKK